MTNGNGFDAIAVPTARARRVAARHLRELAVGDRLAPADLAHERLEHGAPEPVDAVEVERHRERARPPGEPLVERACDLLVARGFGVADERGEVVLGQPDRAHAPCSLVITVTTPNGVSCCQ